MVGVIKIYAYTNKNILISNMVDIDLNQTYQIKMFSTINILHNNEEFEWKENDRIRG